MQLYTLFAVRARHFVQGPLKQLKLTSIPHCYREGREEGSAVKADLATLISYELIVAARRAEDARHAIPACAREQRRAQAPLCRD